MMKKIKITQKTQITSKKTTYSVFGSDVKALFPSIKSENTGRIIRERVEKSKIQLDGFDMKKGLAYISMNQELTNVGGVEHLLPIREAFKRKSRIYIGLLPIRGTPPPSPL